MSDKAILLVEDNPDDEAMTLRALQKMNLGHPILVARDGVEALDFLFGTGARAGQALHPTVVLLDLKLPKIDGLEVLQKVRQNKLTRLQPVVILTSSNEQRDIIEGYNLGANSYVRKPVESTAFRHAVQQLGMYWMLHNERPPRPEGE